MTEPKKIITGIVGEMKGFLRTPVVTLDMPREDPNAATMSFILERVVRLLFMGKQITIIEGDVSGVFTAEDKEDVISADELAKDIGVR